MASNIKKMQIHCGEILVSDNNKDYTILCIFCYKNFKSFDCFVEHRINTCNMTCENNLSVKIENINDMDDNENDNLISNSIAVQNNDNCQEKQSSSVSEKTIEINGALDNINNEVSGLNVKYDRLIDILTNILPQTQSLVQNVAENSIYFNNDSSSEEEFDHLESTIDDNFISVGSTSKSPEKNSEEYDKEDANDSEDLQERRIAKDWELIKKFKNKLDAENYLKNDWAKNSSYKGSKLTKEYYRCNKLKFRGPQCDAKILIRYYETNSDIYIYSNNKDHTHSQLQNKTTVICPRMKNDIIEMATLKLTPRVILKRLSKKYSEQKLNIPSLLQICSLLKRRKR